MITTRVPGAPWAGVKAVTTGGRWCWRGVGSTVKVPSEVPVPEGVTTDSGPVTAPAGTWTSILVPPSCQNSVAATPPKATWVTPAKPAPARTTVAPGAPWAGWNPLTTGGRVWRGTTRKLAALVWEPRAVTTVIAPVAAPAGTCTVIRVSPSPLAVVAATVPNFTAVNRVNPVPVRVTVVSPAMPETGVKDWIFGSPAVAVRPPPPLLVLQASATSTNRKATRASRMRAPQGVAGGSAGASTGMPVGFMKDS